MFTPPLSLLPPWLGDATSRFDLVLHPRPRYHAVWNPTVRKMATTADNEEVMKALASVGNKLRKVGIVIPAMQEELANKIERKDLAK